MASFHNFGASSPISKCQRRHVQHRHPIFRITFADGHSLLELSNAIHPRKYPHNSTSKFTYSLIPLENTLSTFYPTTNRFSSQDNHTLQFPSGIKIFGDTIYVMTSELQNFIAGTQKINDVKYRILVGSVSDLVRGTGCEQRSDECLTQSSHFPTTAHQCFDHTAKLDPVPHPVLNFPFADSNGGENVAYEMAAPVGPTFRRNAHDLGRFRRIFSVSAPLFRYY